MEWWRQAQESLDTVTVFTIHKPSTSSGYYTCILMERLSASAGESVYVSVRASLIVRSVLNTIKGNHDHYQVIFKVKFKINMWKFEQNPIRDKKVTFFLIYRIQYFKLHVCIWISEIISITGKFWKARHICAKGVESCQQGLVLNSIIALWYSPDFEKV